jgi:glycosyltransferase involved in cell wall biosynthesis
MQVSVVIPLYNKAAHIRHALDSVLAQTYGDFEVIVIDDGSTDGSAALAQRCSDPRVRLLAQENAGVSAARNRGVVEARCELIAFLDADDAWQPTFLETICRLAREYPTCGAFATAYSIVEQNGREWFPRCKEITRTPWEGILADYFRFSVEIPGVWTSAVAVRKSVFDSVGLFSVGERLAEDLDMWCRIALRYPIAFSTVVGATYYLNADNRACNANRAGYDLKLLKTLEEALAAPKLPAGLNRESVLEYRNNQLIEIAVEFALSGDGRSAREGLEKAKATRRFRFRLFLWQVLSYIPPKVLFFLRELKRVLRESRRVFS